MSEFLIMFREVLEGVLVVGILYTFIVKTGRKHLKKSIINGVIASFVATAVSYTHLTLPTICSV